MKANYYERFLKLQEEATEIIRRSKSNYDPYVGGNRTTIDQASYNKWVVSTKSLIETTFGSDSFYYTSFNDAHNKRNLKNNHERMHQDLIPILDSIIESADDTEIPSTNTYSNLDIVNNLCLRFPLFVRQLKKRYARRQPIEIKDEYDVQDLFHALLKLHFDDVRPEEFTPSLAGSASRVDFLLKEEEIVIEIKMTRKGLGSKELGNELLIDIAHYSSHQDCKTLVCFVYDPEGYINNPLGIESDLEKISSKLKVKVNILPK